MIKKVRAKIAKNGKKSIEKKLYELVTNPSVIVPTITAMLTLMLIAPKIYTYYRFGISVNYLHIKSTDIAVVAVQLLVHLLSIYILYLISAALIRKTKNKYAKFIKKSFKVFCIAEIILIPVYIILNLVLKKYDFTVVSTIVLISLAIMFVFLFMLDIGVEFYELITVTDWKLVIKNIKEKFLMFLVFLIVFSTIISFYLYFQRNNNLVIIDDNRTYYVVDIYDEYYIVKDCCIDDKRINVYKDTTSILSIESYTAKEYKTHSVKITEYKNE